VVTTDAQRAAACDTVTDPLAAEPLGDINTHITPLQVAHAMSLLVCFGYQYLSSPIYVCLQSKRLG